MLNVSGIILSERLLQPIDLDLGWRLPAAFCGGLHLMCGLILTIFVLRLFGEKRILLDVALLKLLNSLVYHGLFLFDYAFDFNLLGVVVWGCQV